MYAFGEVLLIVRYHHAILSLSRAASTHTLSCVCQYFVSSLVMPPEVQCCRYLAMYCRSFISSVDGPVLCKSQNPSDSCHCIKSKLLWSYHFFLSLYFAVDVQVLARAVMVLSWLQSIMLSPLSR